MSNSKYLNDNELMALGKANVFVEGFQGLVKVERNVAIGEKVKVRIGAILLGQTIIGESSDVGLAGGAVIDNSQIGENSAITGGAKIFHSVIGPHLRNYGSQIKHSQLGANFIIRSLAETKNLTSGNRCKLKMFSRVYNTQMGDENIIGSHTLVSHCFLGDHNIISDYSKIENCHLGDNNKIGSYVHIKGNTQSTETVIEDNCIIGDNVVIQPGTVLYSGSKVPDFAIVMTKNGKTVMSVIDSEAMF